MRSRHEDAVAGACLFILAAILAVLYAAYRAAAIYLRWAFGLPGDGPYAAIFVPVSVVIFVVVRSYLRSNRRTS